VDLGSAGNYKLPLASSSVNETDTVVRVPDGHIVAIGGLMQTELNNRQSGMPGSNGNAVTRTLFGNRTDSGRKRELVVLIKPTIIRNADDWQRSTDQALASFEPTAPRTVTVKAAAVSPPAVALVAPVVPVVPAVLAGTLPLPAEPPAAKPQVVSSPTVNIR
jgi:MSHA biogenesis protein MshL